MLILSAMNRIHVFIIFWIFFSVVDPDSIQHFKWIRIRVQSGSRFLKTQKNTAENCFKSFFYKKFAIYFSLSLHKGRPHSYKEKTSALKREHSALQKMKFINFFQFLGHFCSPGSESGFRTGFGYRDPIQSGSNPDTDPNPQHWFFGTGRSVTF